MAPTPNSALLAAHLREDTADLLALLPAARRAAAGGRGLRQRRGGCVPQRGVRARMASGASVGHGRCAAVCRRTG